MFCCYLENHKKKYFNLQIKHSIFVSSVDNHQTQKAFQVNDYRVCVSVCVDLLFFS